MMTSFTLSLAWLTADMVEMMILVYFYETLMYMDQFTDMGLLLMMSFDG